MAISKHYCSELKMFGISSSVRKANVQCGGLGDFLGGSGQSSKVDIDAGKSLMALTWLTSSGFNLVFEENIWHMNTRK